MADDGSMWTRRRALTAGAAAGAAAVFGGRPAAAAVGVPSFVALGGAAPDGDPLPVTAAAVPTVTTSKLYAPSGLVAQNVDGGNPTWNVFSASDGGSWAPGGGNLTVNLDVPLGAVLTKVEYFVKVGDGTVPAMGGFVDIYEPEDRGYVATIADVDVTGTGRADRQCRRELHAGEPLRAGGRRRRQHRRQRRPWPPHQLLVPGHDVRAGVTAAGVRLRTAAGGKLVPDVDRVVSVATSGSATIVPVAASAVALTVTLTGTEGGGGYVAVFPADETYAGTSSINWFGPDQNLATTVLSPLGTARSVKLRAGIARTHVVVDVTGYYV